MRILSDRLKYEYYKDCAVLLEVDGTKVLVDGLISDKNPFDKIPKVIEAEIMDGEGDFQGLDTLLFTHCHNDHFSGYKLTRYLERNHGAFVALPEVARLDWDYLWDLGANMCRMEGAIGEVRERLLGGDPEDPWAPVEHGIKLEYMKTGHLTFNYPEHFAFNILGENCNVMVTADMDLLRMDLLKRFTMKEHAFLFISNIALWHRKWREALDSMGFEKVFLYHLPDGEDPYGYRSKATKCWGRYKDRLPNWEFLNFVPRNIEDEEGLI